MKLKKPSRADVKATLDSIDFEKLKALGYNVNRTIIRYAINSQRREKQPRFHYDVVEGKRRKAEPVVYDIIFAKTSILADYRNIGVILNDDSGPCRLEGCTGHKMCVRWGDGKYTYPCWKGVSSVTKGVWKIG